MRTGNMLDPTGRSGHSATLLRDGTVLTVGGIRVDSVFFAGGDRECVSSTPLASTEVYVPPTDSLVPPSCALSLAGVDPTGHAISELRRAISARACARSSWHRPRTPPWNY